MNLNSFTKIFNKKKESLKENNKENLAKKIVTSLALIRPKDFYRDSIEMPECDFEEIKRATEADSYIKASKLKYSYMLFKAGYILKSDNQECSNYIKKRFRIMGLATKKPMDILFQEIGDDLLQYSNAFLIKTRVPEIMPGIKAKGFLNKNPVGGYFRADVCSMFVKRDEYGNIIKWIQRVEGQEKEFQPSEVVHFYLDKDSTSAYGTPRITAALEDVKLLRRLEGYTVSMIYRYAMPLIQWKIGLPQTGFQATETEIENAKREIEHMSLDGSVVTNEKTNIQCIGADGQAIDINGYLQYFENRAFSALGVSQSQMGRGGSKQDADSMESQAHDTIKYVQRILSIFIENFIISELALEGGFDPINKEEDFTYFKFNEINIETKIKVENHEMAKFQGNMISFEEMRREIGYKEDVDDATLYNNFIKVKAEKAIATAKCDESIRLAKENAKLNSTTNSTSNTDTENEDENTNTAVNKGTNGGNKLSPKGNGSIKSLDANKDITNKNTPENQYGKTSVKVKEAASPTIKNKKKHYKTYSKFYDIYNNAKKDIINKPSDFDLIASVTIDNFEIEYINLLDSFKQQALKDLKKDLNLNEINLNDISLNEEILEFRKTIKNTFKDIKKKINQKNDDDININSIFTVMEYRIRFCIETLIPKAYWTYYVQAGKQLGVKKATIIFNGSKDAENHEKNIDLNNFSKDDIPPFHPFCDCKIKLKKGDL